MHPQQQQNAGQWGPPPGQPPQQWGPPQPPATHRKKSSTLKVVAIVAGALFVLSVAVGIAMTGDDGGQDPAPVASASRTATVPPVDVVPTPDAGQRRAYLAALAGIDPGLVVNEERALRRAGRICERIVNPPEGSRLTLRQYVVEELSGGNATIDEAQAARVVRAVRVWCR